MNGYEQRIERLILRSLDGALSEDDQLDLNRALIRDPAARRLLDTYRELDELSAGALRQAVPERGASLDPGRWVAACGQRKARRPAAWWRHRGKWLVPGAVAAALLAVAVHRATLPAVRAPWTEVPLVGAVDRSSSHLPLARTNPGMMRSVSDGPRERIKREVAQDVYGILGSDGRIYWIEVDRVRTITRPNTASLYSRVLNEL